MHPIHPMVVHFPIALLTTSVACDVLAFWWKPEKCREASLLMLVIGVITAGVAVVTGHFAEEAVEHSGIPEQALEIHETLGFATFWIFAGLLGLRAATWLEWMRQKPILALLIGVVGVIVLLVASYFGGDLVYSFGAGVAGRAGG